MFLRDYDNYNSVKELSKINLLEENGDNSDCIAGVYKDFNEKRLLFYRKEGKLKLGINNREILVTDKTHIILDIVERNKYRLSVFDNNHLFFELTYFFNREDYMFEEDYVSSFIEEEDFNFGLFLKNVINNEERRKIVFIH